MSRCLGHPAVPWRYRGETSPRWRRCLLALGLVLWLVGCSEPDLAALDRELSSLRAASDGVDLPALPELPRYVAEAYDQADRRSPFRERLPTPEAMGEGSADLAPDPQRALDPLEAYALEELKLVGTLRIGNRPSALVRAPDGEVHRLTSGDHLGTDHGRIVSISSRAVQLVEVVNNGRGGWIERTRRLTLDDPKTN